MNVITALCATGATVAMTLGALTFAPDALAQIHAQTQAQGLAAETSTLGLALSTDPDGMPRTLTCVPDAADPTGRPCASFADYDLTPSGSYIYVLEPTGTGMRLHGWTADQTQHAVWDSQTGGLTSVSDTALVAAIR